MISKDTLPQLLTQLGFKKQGTTFSKTINAAALKVDTKQERITYPDGLIVNGEFTCNFSSPENFDASIGYLKKATRHNTSSWSQNGS